MNATSVFFIVRFRKTYRTFKNFPELVDIVGPAFFFKAEEPRFPIVKHGYATPELWGCLTCGEKFLQGTRYDPPVGVRNSPVERYR